MRADLSANAPMDYATGRQLPKSTNAEQGGRRRGGGRHFKAMGKSLTCSAERVLKLLSRAAVLGDIALLRLIPRVMDALSFVDLL